MIKVCAMPVATLSVSHYKTSSLANDKQTALRGKWVEYWWTLPIIWVRVMPVILVLGSAVAHQATLKTHLEAVNLLRSPVPISQSSRGLGQIKTKVKSQLFQPFQQSFNLPTLPYLKHRRSNLVWTIMSSSRGNREGPGSQTSRGLRKATGVSTTAPGIRQPSTQSQHLSAPTQKSAETPTFTQRTRDKTPLWFKSSSSSTPLPSITPTPSTDPHKKSNPWVKSATRKLGFSRGDSKLPASHGDSHGDNMDKTDTSVTGSEPPKRRSVCFTILIDLTTSNQL